MLWQWKVNREAFAGLNKGVYELHVLSTNMNLMCNMPTSQTVKALTHRLCFFNWCLHTTHTFFCCENVTLLKFTISKALKVSASSYQQRSDIASRTSASAYDDYIACYLMTTMYLGKLPLLFGIYRLLSILLPLSRMWHITQWVSMLSYEHLKLCSELSWYLSHSCMKRDSLSLATTS